MEAQSETNRRTLALEKEALMQEILAAFDGVSRFGGISWRQATLDDLFGGTAEIRRSLRKDTDNEWQELIDDIAWEPNEGIGGWPFLDAISARYYLPAAMIRCLQGYVGERLAYFLSASDSRLFLPPDPTLSQSALGPRREQCIRRFLRYMISFEALEGFPNMTSDWEKALERRDGDEE